MEKLNIYSTTHTLYLALKVIDEINNLRNYDQVFSDFEKTELGECKIESFANGELTCQYKESIRDKKIYIFGQTGTHEIMELLLMIDAAKRSSAGKIIAVIPSYGYARQDKKEGIRGPMGAKLVADLLSAAGIDGLITIDLHADAIQGFFNVPVNHINGFSIFGSELKKIIADNHEKYIICSPDAGGFVRANKFAKKLGLEGAVAINKERDKPGSISKMLLMADVTGKNIILVDDLADSCKTLCMASDYLMNNKKANSVIAICTHPILSGNAIDTILKTSNLSNIYFSDTLYFNNEFENSKIKIISCATIIAKIIGRISKGKSMDLVNS
jgi:ribose-phosphate pyrophosphokinase